MRRQTRKRLIKIDNISIHVIFITSIKHTSREGAVKQYKFKNQTP